MDVRHSSNGVEIFFENYHVVFGDRNLSRDALKQKFSQYSFEYLKQVHGDAVVNLEEPPKLEEKVADAHFTSRLRTAPVIATADCLPVAIITDELVAMIHAGWRGVQQNIIGKTIARLKIKKPDLARVFIGPHIHFDIFEVHKNVSDQLQQTYEATGFLNLDQVFFPHMDPNKNFVDLSAIARAQISKAGLNLANVWISEVDTMTNPQFASFRRDAANAGRQYSFAVRLP